MVNSIALDIALRQGQCAFVIIFNKYFIKWICKISAIIWIKCWIIVLSVTHWVAAYARWLPRMLKVARFQRSTPGCGWVAQIYTYYARGAQGVLPMRAGEATSQLDLSSLMSLSVAGCGRMQLGVPHWATSVHYCK